MSVISEQEYLSQLYIIQSQNPPSLVLFPESKRIYDIDLSTRQINSPEFLSVAYDHGAETIYFRVDRFHGYMDLSNTICVIQYYTPDGEPHIYPVPFFDVLTEKHNNKMLFQWCIDGAATQFQGPVSYSVRFYLIEEKEKQFQLIYNMSTEVAESKVLHGMQVTKLNKEFDISAEGYDYLLSLIQNVNRDGVYWEILD